MINNKVGFLLFLIMTLGSNLNAQKLIVVKDNVVYLLNFNYSFTSSTGSDGVKISYPYSGWTTSTGSDGRKIAYPYSGWTTSTGSDGRKIAFPYSGWTTSTGSDGRKIAYPYSGWTTSTGSDGRKIAYPYSGWTTSTGSDGRKIAYPYSGWTTSTGSDGRKIAYPYNWSVASANGRKYAEMMEVDGGLAIVFQRPEIAAKIEKIILDFDMDTACDYALYLLINENQD
jgi:hypothetical protein